MSETLQKFGGSFLAGPPVVAPVPGRRGLLLSGGDLQRVAPLSLHWPSWSARMAGAERTPHLCTDGGISLHV